MPLLSTSWSGWKHRVAPHPNPLPRGEGTWPLTLALSRGERENSPSPQPSPAGRGKTSPEPSSIYSLEKIICIFSPHCVHDSGSSDARWSSESHTIPQKPARYKSRNGENAVFRGALAHSENSR